MRHGPCQAEGSAFRCAGAKTSGTLFALATVAAVAVQVVPVLAQDDLASRFHTAPSEISRQHVLARITVNGVDGGLLDIVADAKSVTLPHETLEALRLGNLSGGALDLVPGGPVQYKWDPSTSALSLTVGVRNLKSLRIGADGDAAAPLALSPEAWGGWANYAVNLRHQFGSTQSTGTLDGGALAELHLTGPDFNAFSAWSYDSDRTGQSTVRLDTNATWRPVGRSLSATGGDISSAVSSATRSFRYLGFEVGTDHSADPAFNPNPIAQVTGTAAAESNIDVYVDSQRVQRAQTAGGDFTLALPGAGSGSRVVVTDVTGKETIISVNAPSVDAQVIAQGLLLWSAGAGVPRFGYGTQSSVYSSNVYGHANARYGLTDKLTLTGHAEGGQDLGEAEAGANVSLFPWLAVRGDLGASVSQRGKGGFGSLAVVVSGPWGLSLDASISQATGGFDDVVSVSGVKRARQAGTPVYLALPAASNQSLRLTWQVDKDLSLTASYDRYKYPVTGSAGFASVSAQKTVYGLPVFVNLSTNIGGTRDTTLLAGVSVNFGNITSSVSAGYGTQGPSGAFSASRPLEDSVGAVGWRALGSQANGQTYASAEAETRTGYGIPGAEVDSFGHSAVAYATLRGSVGFVGNHLFAGDPIDNGVIVADAGAPGIPVTVNGYPKGRTWWDGKAAIPVPVAGTPQTVGVAAEDLPLDMVADETERMATIRQGGAAVLHFGVRSHQSGAIVTVTDGGRAPPAGSTLVGSGSSAPVDSRGRAYLPNLMAGETLSLRRADGTSCSVATSFDGKGGPARRIGPFACKETVP